MLGRHLRSSHQISIPEYQQQFPGAEVTCSETRDKMRNSNCLTGKIVGSLESRYGEVIAGEIKSKIGANSGAARTGKKRPNQAETIRKTWVDRRGQWSEGIKASYTQDRKKRVSESMRKFISTAQPKHVLQPSQFEQSIASYLISQGFMIQQQFRLSVKTFGTAFYDIFVPELNLLIECDGEYWHTSNSRIQNDIRKTKIAEYHAISILRISDSEFNRRLSNIQLILNLLCLDSVELSRRNQRFIALRQSQLIQDIIR